MSNIEATTESEKIIQLDGKIDKLDNKIDEVCRSIDRAVEAIEKLESTRVNDQEDRINALETWKHEWSGVYKFLTIIGLLLGIISVILTIYLKLK